MSGFDTSQPITDKAALEDIDEVDDATKPKAADPPAEPDELGDATPGPARTGAGLSQSVEARGSSPGMAGRNPLGRGTRIA
jgi:hypothetical protein